jgi:hypothetical protein
MRSSRGMAKSLAAAVRKSTSGAMGTGLAVAPSRGSVVVPGGSEGIVGSCISILLSWQRSRAPKDVALCDTAVASTNRTNEIKSS